MRLKRSALFLFLTLSKVAAARTPSFDCSAAQTQLERAVCANPKLSDMNARMAPALRALEAALSQPSAALVSADQGEWLQWVEKVCPPAVDRGQEFDTCLTDRYSARLAQLTAAPLRAGGLVIYPRAHYVFVAGKAQPKGDAAGKDHGFGYGEFSWPQIDDPSRTQQAWNDAVYAATINSTGMGQTQPKSLDEAVDSDGYVNDSYTVSSADSRFIDVQLESDSYEWGGAHGNDSITSFGWWLGKGRALQADDIFASNSGWHETVAAQTLAKLQRDPGPEALWQPGKYVAADQLTNAIAECVAHPSAWTVTARSLTITFGSYAVGPYSSGMPSAQFTWQELQPILASDFDPAALPQSQQTPK